MGVAPSELGAWCSTGRAAMPSGGADHRVGVGLGQRPRSFLARALSALETSTVPVRRRVTLEAFFSRLWRLPAFSRRILPDPVTRKRLLAPECGLFFGIFSSSASCAG